MTPIDPGLDRVGEQALDTVDQVMPGLFSVLAVVGIVLIIAGLAKRRWGRAGLGALLASPFVLGIFLLNIGNWALMLLQSIVGWVFGQMPGT